MIERTELVDAQFVERPNRFVAVVQLADGPCVEAHVGDPGRLVELFVPGATLRLRPAEPGATRRTRYGVALVRARRDRGPWVSVEPARANALVRDLLGRRALPGVAADTAFRAEVPSGRHRFDFRLDDPRGGSTWLEVKSVTLVERGVALFPDAPTERGRAHMDALAARRAEGDQARLLFVVQRSDARAVRVHAALDPRLDQAVRRARDAGVRVDAVRFGLDRHASARYLGELPVQLDAHEALPGPA